MSKKIFCLLIALLMVLTVSCVSAAEDTNDTVAAVDEQVAVQKTIDDVQLESNDNDSDVLSAGTEDPNFNMKPNCNDYGDVSFSASTEKDATGTVHVTFTLKSPGGDTVEADETLELVNGSVKWGGPGNYLPKGSYTVWAMYSGDNKYASATLQTPDTGPDAFNVPKYPISLNFTSIAVNEKGNIVVNGQLDNSKADGPYVLTFTNKDNGRTQSWYRQQVQSGGIIVNEKAPELGAGEYIVTISYVGTDQYFPASPQVKNINISDISINKTTIVLGVGNKTDSGASLDPADAGNLTFTSSNESVVTVNATTGVITAVTFGDAIVTVSCAGNDRYGPAVNKTISVSVRTLTNITVDPAEVALYIGENITLNATLTPKEVGNLTFVSSNPNVATVNATTGVITAVNKGNAKITVSFPGNDTYAASEVVVPVTVSLYDASVTVNNDTLDLKVGDNFTIVTTTSPEGLDVTYVVDKSGVYSFNETTGVVTALKNGTGSILVKVGGGNYSENSTVVTVTVSLYDASVSVNNSTLDLFVEDTFKIVPTTNPEGLNVTYVVDNSGVYSFNETTGVVTALKEGNASVIVKVSGNANYTENSTTVTVTVSKVHTEINVNSTVDLKIKEERGLGATLTPADAGNLTFVSSNSSVVTVDKNGNVKAVAVGEANITVSFAGDNRYAAADNKTIAVTVTLKDASVSVNNSTLDLFVEDTFTIVPTTNPEGLNVTYVVDNSGVYSFNEVTGVVTALKNGTGSILVKVGGDGIYAENSTTVTVTVSKVHTEINVNSTVDLKIKEERGLGATLTPADAGNLTFVSSNSSVVTVDKNGKVTAVAVGEANITVSFAGDDKYAAADNKTIVVTVSLYDASVTVNNDTLDLKVGDNFTIVPTTNPEGLNVTYVVDNSGVYSFNEVTGVVTALKNGTGSILVKVGGDGIYAENSTTVTVTVSLYDASVTVNNDTLDLLIGDNFTIVTTTSPEGLDVTYVPDGSGVYSFNEVTGVVTALKKGTGSILVKVGGDGIYAENSTVVTVTVTDKIPTEIIIANSTLNVKMLNLISAGAALNPSEAGNLTYTSSNDSVAMVINDMIIPVGVGQAVITVSFAGNDDYLAAENKTITVNVSLNDASVTVENATVDLKVGDAFNIVATTVPSGLDVTYVSDNSGVVSVDENGKITALKAGSAVITVKVGGDGVYVENSTTVKVTVTKIPTEIKVAANTINIDIFDEAATGASLVPNAGKLTYTSSNPEVASVQNGKIKGLKNGKATITVSFAGDDKYAAAENKTITVNVNKIKTQIIASNIKTTFKTSKKLVVKLADAKGKGLIGKKITVSFNNKVFTRTVDSKGQIVLTVTNKLVPKTYDLSLSFAGDNTYLKSTKSVKVVVAKGTPTVYAKSKSFKLSAKNKYYTATVKYKGKVLKGAKMVLKFRTKIYVAKVGSNGKATFKITHLNKRARYVGLVGFLGNKYYGKAKSIRISVPVR